MDNLIRFPIDKINAGEVDSENIAAKGEEEEEDKEGGRRRRIGRRSKRARDGVRASDPLLKTLLASQVGVSFMCGIDPAMCMPSAPAPQRSKNLSVIYVRAFNYRAAPVNDGAVPRIPYLLYTR